MAASELGAWYLAMIRRSRHYKSLFFGDGDVLSMSGERVLADLRGFCWADRGTIFDRDALEMARREGRREVFVRLSHMLGLNEANVQQLVMENDDGIG